MSNAFTAVNQNIRKAKKRLVLMGSKSKPEPAQHIIEFPGGAIEVSRTDKGEYWAHIIINRRHVWPDTDGYGSAYGEVVESRIDSMDGIISVPGEGGVDQIAVLIRPAPNGS